MSRHLPGEGYPAPHCTEEELRRIKVPPGPAPGAPRRLRTQAERDTDGTTWRAAAQSRPGYATYPQTAPGDPSWWRRDVSAPTFEHMLSDPHGQFDPDGELLPHLLAFGPPKSKRPWLFDAVVETTAVPVDGETCTRWCGFCHLNTPPQPEQEEPETWCVCGAPDSGPCPRCLPADAVARAVDSLPQHGPDPALVRLAELMRQPVPPRRRWWHRKTRKD